MKAWCTLEQLKKMIDRPIGELRGLLPLVNSEYDAKIAYGRLTKGELVVEHLLEYYNATDERT